MTKQQNEAFQRITLLRQIETRTGQSFGAVERKVLADLPAKDIIAVLDALIESGVKVSNFGLAGAL